MSSTVRIAATPQSRVVSTGFTADLAWERCQEQAVIAFRAGAAVLPSRLWAEATVGLERYDQRMAVGLDAWFATKPGRMSDLRKLLAVCC